MGLRLDGKVAVVMGAGSSAPGFSNGKAVAVAYAREGAAVLAVDFDAARAEETAKLVLDEGHRARAIRADVTREDDVEAAIGHAVEAFGGVDIVHNNARAGAAEYGPENIRVNCIRIGFCDTPLVRRRYQSFGIHGDELEAKMKESGEIVPLRHERTQVWDVANAAVFLASDEARHITGVI